MDAKLKHLEFIQSVITRMNANSFLIKGWAVTLVSALFALGAKDSNINFMLISYIVIPVFWGLDGFFLSQEKRYRKLYNDVRLKSEGQIDFSMNASSYNVESTGCCMVSKSLGPFYGTLVLATLIVILAMYFHSP